DDRDEERIDGDVQSTILPHRVSWFSRARNIDRRRETRHEPLEPLGRGTEHRSGGVILCGDRDNRDVSLAGNLLDPCDPVSGLLGHRSESLGDRRPYARRGGGRTDPELRPGSTRQEGHLRGREKPDLLGVDRVLQPLMPLDLPVKVRSWELTVYPRSHIRRWLGVTRPAQARM